MNIKACRLFRKIQWTDAGIKEGILAERAILSLSKISVFLRIQFFSFSGFQSAYFSILYQNTVFQKLKILLDTML
jgi:hypothetical protein